MTALDQAMQCFQSGRIAEADALCSKFLRKAPKHPGALHLSGLCAARRGAPREAVALLLRAVEVAPGYVEAHNDLGNIYLQLERGDAAARCFRRVIALAPGFAPAHNNLGALLNRAGKFAEAIDVLSVAVALAPAHARFHKNLGDAYWQAGREAEALPHHEAAIQLWQGAPDAGFFEHMWRSFAVRGLRERALAVAETWLVNDPENPVALHCRAASGGQKVPPRASDGYVQNTFDLFAATFDEQLAAVEYRGPELVMAALGRVAGHPVAAVLDAGCGTGLCGPLLRPLSERLVGVDLSGKMLDHARRRDCYDELVEAELTAYIDAHPLGFDWIVCADTLVYFGDLAPIAAASFAALRPGGHFVFTLEKEVGANPTSTFQLYPHGRYGHDRGYMAAVVESAGFDLLRIDEEPYRLESGVPVLALIVTVRRPGDPS